MANGLFALDDTENDTDTETDNDNCGFRCNMQSTSHCTETMPLIPMANFSHFIYLPTHIILSVAQCEHTIKGPITLNNYNIASILSIQRLAICDVTFLFVIAMTVSKEKNEKLHRILFCSSLGFCAFY